MVAMLALEAGAQELELGVGRAAVLRPHVTPTAVSVADPLLLEVVPVAPALVVFGRKAGTTPSPSSTPAARSNGRSPSPPTPASPRRARWSIHRARS